MLAIVDYFDSLPAAQEVVEAAFEARLQGAARKHAQRAGGLYQAAELSSETTGLELDKTLAIVGLLSSVADRMKSEQEELDNL